MCTTALNTFVHMINKGEVHARIISKNSVEYDSEQCIVFIFWFLCSTFRLRLRHAVILISNGRTSASKKINLMTLVQTLTISTTTFERMKEKFDGFRQTENEYVIHALFAPYIYEIGI